MFNLKNSLAALAGLALLVVSIPVLFMPASTHGQENSGNGPPANNPNPSELLSVRDGDASQCPGGPAGAREINDVSKPDGTIALNAYVVPAGQVFVITDVYFRLLSKPDSSILVRFGVPCGSSCMVPLVDAVVVTDSVGTGATQVSLGHGIVVRPGVTLCVADVNHSSPNSDAQVHGYLANDR
jgi:hypothetical protein